MVVIRGVSHLPIELKRKVIGGRACRSPPKSMLRNAIRGSAPNIHQRGRVLNPLSSPWPFPQWQLDIVGPFPKATGYQRYLLVSTNCFTKWVRLNH